MMMGCHAAASSRRCAIQHRRRHNTAPVVTPSPFFLPCFSVDQLAASGAWSVAWLEALHGCVARWQRTTKWMCDCVRVTLVLR